MKYITWISTGVVITGFALLCNQAPKETLLTPSLPLAELLDSIGQIHQIPGMAVVVVKDDTLIYETEGYIKLGKEDKVQVSTKFHLGSNTKAFTSWIAMKLVQAGKISLQTRVVDQLGINSYRKEYAEITLQDLLSHQARIRPYTSGKEFDKLPDKEGSSQERRQYFAELVLQGKPVKKGTYSNAGFAIASRMLEIATDSSFEFLVAQAMEELQVDYCIGFPNKCDTLNAWGHWRETRSPRRGLQAVPLSHSYELLDVMLAAGDLSMNITDHGKWLQLHLQGLQGADNLLPTGIYQKMHYFQDGYGLGWRNEKQGESRVSFHNGSAGTYYCQAYFSPDKNIALAIFINSAQKEAVQGVYKLRRLLINRFGS
ncbi:MAG: serine hydrolase domain-containing protein [Bacteroidota bacterium]